MPTNQADIFWKDLFSFILEPPTNEHETTSKTRIDLRTMMYQHRRTRPSPTAIMHLLLFITFIQFSLLGSKFAQSVSINSHPTISSNDNNLHDLESTKPISTTPAAALATPGPTTTTRNPNSSLLYPPSNRNPKEHLNHQQQFYKSQQQSLTLANITKSQQITSTNNVKSIRCHCSLCETPNVDYCNITLQGRSRCFKSTAKRFNDTGQYYFLEYNYGCFTEREGDLHASQCDILVLGNNHPVSITCCNDGDLCNTRLADPNLNEPRWAGVMTSIDEQNPTQETPKPFDYSIVILISIMILICLIFIQVTVMTYNLCVSHFQSLESKSSASSTSTATSKADLAKNWSIAHFDQIIQGHFNNPSSNSSAGHTYQSSSTDDICLKPDMYARSTYDDDMLYEMTSGLGEHALNQRTIAQTISSGRKDHVGSGRFGRVFVGSYHGENVAVKAFRSEDDESWRREDYIFRRLNHENIVRFISSEITHNHVSSNEIWMFLEYCPYRSLCDFLDNNLVLKPEQSVKILYSIINGLNYLHEDYAQGTNCYKPSIAHRDIKSKNILMRTPEVCCIADFGHALIKIDETSLDRGKYPNLHVGTVRYMAPEILRKNELLNYDHFSTFAQADLYQYGLVMWEVCNRTSSDQDPHPVHKLPYDERVSTNPEIDDMIKLVCEEQYRPPIKDYWWRDTIMRILSDLMVECWRENPRARMETLGVKKKLRQTYDQIVSSQQLYDHMRDNRSPLVNDPNNLDLHKSKGKIFDYTV